MRPPQIRPYTGVVIQPTPIANFGFLLKPKPYLSKENCIRRDIMKQVSTIPVNTRMLPLLDPNEFRRRCGEEEHGDAHLFCARVVGGGTARLDFISSGVGLVDPLPRNDHVATCQLFFRDVDAPPTKLVGNREKPPTNPLSGPDLTSVSHRRVWTECLPMLSRRRE